MKVSEAATDRKTTSAPPIPMERNAVEGKK